MRRESARNYTREDVVAYYDGYHGLEAAESVLFSAWLKPQMEILDLGVGGGRTTPYLAAQARRYVGIDLSPAMVQTCRARYPELDFELMDATDLSKFQKASFDAVIFSFNGIDAIPTPAERSRCLAGCARVLRRGGVLIFSSHNSSHLIYRPSVVGAGGLRKVWRFVYAVMHTAANVLSRVASPAFWRGYGRVWDFSTDGGLWIHVARPERVSREVGAHGLAVRQVVAHPPNAGRLTAAWYYYASVKEA